MSEQAVSTTPEVEPTQVSTENEPTAQDDLDALLNEYEPASTEPETAQPAQPEVAPDRLAVVESFIERQNRKDIESGLSESTKLMRDAAGDAVANIPDDALEGLMHLEAFRQPKILEIFQDRERNPAAWNKVATALGKKFAQNLSQTDRAATQSWDAVDSAVHSASTSTNTTEAPKDLSKMSDQEFLAFKRGL